MRLAELRPDSFKGESFGVTPFGGAAQQARILGAFDGFLNGKPGIGFDTSIEEFPIELVDLLLPSFEALRLSRLEHLAAESPWRSSEHLGRYCQYGDDRTLLDRQRIASLQTHVGMLDEFFLILLYFLGS